MRENEKGFTLFELMVATVIFGIMGLLIWNIFFTTYNNYKRLDEHKRVLEEVRAITQLVGDEIQRAEKVIVIGQDTNITPSPDIEVKKEMVVGKGIKFKVLKLYKSKEDAKSKPNCVIKWVDEELYYGNEDVAGKFTGEKVSEYIKGIYISKTTGSDILEWDIVMPNISDKKRTDDSNKDLENIVAEKVYKMSTSLSYKYSSD